MNKGLVNSSYEYDDLSELGIEFETYENEVEDILELDNANNDIEFARELEGDINSSNSSEIGTFSNIHTSFIPEEDEDLLIINEII